MVCLPDHRCGSRLPKHFPSFWSCWGCSHRAYPWGCRMVSSLYRQGWSAVLCQPKAPWGQLLTSVNERVACTWGLLITLLPLVAVAITSSKMFSRQQRDSPVPECCLKVCIPSGSCCSDSWEAASGPCRTSSQAEINAGCFKLWPGVLHFNFEHATLACHREAEVLFSVLKCFGSWSREISRGQRCWGCQLADRSLTSCSYQDVPVMVWICWVFPEIPPAVLFCRCWLCGLQSVWLWAVAVRVLQWFVLWVQEEYCQIHFIKLEERNDCQHRWGKATKHLLNDSQSVGHFPGQCKVEAGES